MTVTMAAQLADALGTSLSDVIRRAEQGSTMRHSRMALRDHFLNEKVLKQDTGLTIEMLANGIESCYRTLDIIDEQLAMHESPPISRLVELANFSSMLGNLLGAGVAHASEGMYKRNQPHTYPDLLPQMSGAVELEIKTALETNKPKGHLPKAGYYMTFRYVLGDVTGRFQRGKRFRGDTAWLWEVRLGRLEESDFDLSNTPGDSGKTAVMKTKALERMALVYFVPEYLPYARVDRYKTANGLHVTRPGSTTPEGKEPE